MQTTDRLSDAFAALANPTRRDILHRLRRGPMTVGALARAYPMSRVAVSQHLGRLERAGLVTRDARSQWVDCVLTDEGLDEVSAWVREQRSEWIDRLDRLEEHLHGRTAGPPGLTDAASPSAPRSGGRR